MTKEYQLFDTENGVGWHVVSEEYYNAHKSSQQHRILSAARMAGGNFVNVDCDGPHEYVKVTTTVSGSNDTDVFWQCGRCGLVLTPKEYRAQKEPKDPPKGKRPHEFG